MDKLGRDAGSLLLEIEPYIHDSPLMASISNLLHAVVSERRKMPAPSAGMMNYVQTNTLPGAPALDAAQYAVVIKQMERMRREQEAVNQQHQRDQMRGVHNSYQQGLLGGLSTKSPKSPF